MAASRISAAPKRSFRPLVIFPLIITGVAFACAAVCLSAVAVLSVTLKVSGHPGAESRRADVRQLLQNEPWNGTTGGLASAPPIPQRSVQFAGLESRLARAQPLLRSDVRKATSTAVAGVPAGLQPG